MFSMSLNCLIKPSDADNLKTIGYMISFYGLFLTIGCLCIILLMELIIYFCKSFIKEK